MDKHPPGKKPAAKKSTSSDQQYVWELNPNDVLLGRGAPIISYQGNVRFRALVNDRKTAYIGTGRQQIKHQIAKEIVDEINGRNGRFLRRVDNPAVVDSLNLPKSITRVWRVVHEKVAIEKAKQALRDKEPVQQQNELVHPRTTSTANLPGVASLRQSTSLPGQSMASLPIQQQNINLSLSAEAPLASRVASLGPPHGTTSSSSLQHSRNDALYRALLQRQADRHLQNLLDQQVAQQLLLQEQRQQRSVAAELMSVQRAAQAPLDRDRLLLLAALQQQQQQQQTRLDRLGNSQLAASLSTARAQGRSSMAPTNRATASLRDAGALTGGRGNILLEALAQQAAALPTTRSAPSALLQSAERNEEAKLPPSASQSRPSTSRQKSSSPSSGSQSSNERGASTQH